MSEVIYAIRTREGYFCEAHDDRQDAVNELSYYQSKFPEDAPFSIHEEQRLWEFDPRGE